MGWDGPILTDSGGFQVFSLRDTLLDGGRRRRHLPLGLRRRAGALHAGARGARSRSCSARTSRCASTSACPPAPARAELEEAVRRTTLWAERQRDLPRAPGQLRFAITQGGLDGELQAPLVGGARRARLRRLRDRRAQRGGAPRADVRRDDRGRGLPARGEAALLHGDRRPGGRARGDLPRRRHVRLRPADAHRAHRAARSRAKAGSTSATPASLATRGRSRRAVRARPAPASAGPTSGTSSTSRRSSGCGCSACIICASCSISSPAARQAIERGEFLSWQGRGARRSEGSHVVDASTMIGSERGRRLRIPLHHHHRVPAPLPDRGAAAAAAPEPAAVDAQRAARSATRCSPPAASTARVTAPRRRRGFGRDRAPARGAGRAARDRGHNARARGRRGRGARRARRRAGGCLGEPGAGG